MSIERDRALVRAGYSWGIDAANGNGPTPLTDEIVLQVNHTHPPTDEALLLAVAEAVDDALHLDYARLLGDIAADGRTPGPWLQEIVAARRARMVAVIARVLAERGAR